MKDDDFIISGFQRNPHNEYLLNVDFSEAKRLNRSGSTCDAYEATIQRRRVFIKRLKAEHRDKPVYRAAFDKEYDIGVSLSHPSLPRYIASGDGYIVMDFIEGDTLADLIKRDDSRLKDKKFVAKLLSELINVVEYLHHRNIVHCDIKPDNIIISPYNDRPATLIDLDKAYTAWLDSTSGDPSKFDCESCADGRIDFKAIGKIAAKLGFNRLADACRRENATADSLLKLLRQPKRTFWIVVAFIVSAGFIGFWLKAMQVERVDEGEKGDEVERVEDKDSVESVAPVKSISSDSVYAKKQPQTLFPEQSAIDNAWITSLIKKQSKEIEKYKHTLLRTLNCDTISILNKRKAISDYLSAVGKAGTIVIHSAIEKYSALPELDVQTAVRDNPEWQRMEREKNENYMRLMKWDPKEYLHPSDLLVSQPDTPQDAGHPAQHR